MVPPHNITAPSLITRDLPLGAIMDSHYVRAHSLVYLDIALHGWPFMPPSGHNWQHPFRKGLSSWVNLFNDLCSAVTFCGNGAVYSIKAYNIRNFTYYIIPQLWNNVCQLTISNIRSLSVCLDLRSSNIIQMCKYGRDQGILRVSKSVIIRLWYP